MTTTTTLPPEIEAAIVTATTDQTRADGHDAVSASFLRAAITRALSDAREAGRREGAAGQRSFTGRLFSPA